MMRSGFFLIIVTLTLILSASPGCTKYQGSSGGRIDTTVSTRAEMSDPRIRTVALVEFSDQVAERIAQDLRDLPEISEAPNRATIVFGDIQNRTGIVDSDEFEMVRSRIRNSLLQSKYIRKNVRFVESRARMEQLRQREFDSSAANSAEPSIDINTAYILNADVYRIERGSTNQYYMEVQLVGAATNEIVFSDRYDVKQQNIHD